MAKMILGFIVLFALIAAGLSGFFAATGREKLQLTKLLGYSMGVAALTSLVIATIVILF